MGVTEIVMVFVSLFYLAAIIIVALYMLYSWRKLQEVKLQLDLLHGKMDELIDDETDKYERLSHTDMPEE